MSLLSQEAVKCLIFLIRQQGWYREECCWLDIPHSKSTDRAENRIGMLLLQELKHCVNLILNLIFTVKKKIKILVDKIAFLMMTKTMSSKPRKSLSYKETGKTMNLKSSKLY